MSNNSRGPYEIPGWIKLQASSTPGKFTCSTNSAVADEGEWQVPLQWRSKNFTCSLHTAARTRGDEGHILVPETTIPLSSSAGYFSTHHEQSLFRHHSQATGNSCKDLNLGAITLKPDVNINAGLPQGRGIQAAGFVFRA